MLAELWVSGIKDSRPLAKCRLKQLPGFAVFYFFCIATFDPLHGCQSSLSGRKYRFLPTPHSAIPRITQTTGILCLQPLTGTKHVPNPQNYTRVPWNKALIGARTHRSRSLSPPAFSWAQSCLVRGELRPLLGKSQLVAKPPHSLSLLVMSSFTALRPFSTLPVRVATALRPV